AELPLTVSEESAEVRWVPWPLRGAGPERSTAALPEGTVPDLAGTLEQLALYLARRSGSSEAASAAVAPSPSALSSTSTPRAGRFAAIATPSRKPCAFWASG